MFQQATPVRQLLYNEACLRIVEHPQQLHHKRMPGHLSVDVNLGAKKRKSPLAEPVRVYCFNRNFPPRRALDSSEDLRMATLAFGGRGKRKNGVDRGRVPKQFIMRCTEGGDSLSSRF